MIPASAAERMLQAIQEQEKDVKEKVDKKKAAKAKVKSEDDRPKI